MDSEKFKVKSSKLKFKIQNSGRRITKLLLFLGIKEGYLLSKNLYGLLQHPKLTFNRIYRERDFSQGILIFGLPIGVWFGWVFILLISRLFIFGHLQFGFWAKFSLLFSSIFSLIALLLIANYFYIVWKKERNEK